MTCSLGPDLAESLPDIDGELREMQTLGESHPERSTRSPEYELSLLGRFALVDPAGGSVVVSSGTQRLLALLALRDRVVHRASVAGTLWPDVSESRAHASLRSALLRIPVAARSVVVVTDSDLSLSEGIRIDLTRAREFAHRVLDDAVTADDHELNLEGISRLSHDLLPGWVEDWVVADAEEWRQTRLHALEALTSCFSLQARFGDATAAALAAIKAEPLRESAHAALIRVHLAEGNRSEAFRQFARFQDLLEAALGIEPTPRLRALLDT